MCSCACKPFVTALTSSPPSLTHPPSPAHNCHSTHHGPKTANSKKSTKSARFFASLFPPKRETDPEKEVTLPLGPQKNPSGAAGGAAAAGPGDFGRGGQRMRGLAARLAPATPTGGRLISSTGRSSFFFAEPPKIVGVVRLFFLYKHNKMGVLFFFLAEPPKMVLSLWLSFYNHETLE